MTTEPNYTDAQIEELITDCEGVYAWRQNPSAERFAQAFKAWLTERQAAMQGQGGEGMPQAKVVAYISQSSLDFFASSLSHGLGYEKFAAAYVSNIAYKDELIPLCLAIQPPQPVWSVSDEDVRVSQGSAEKWARENGFVAYMAPSGYIRAALEHFAAIAQEKQS